MKLVIAATPAVALPTIALLKKAHEVKLVTQPDRPAGRGKALRASEIALNFPDATKPENEAELAALLSDADLLITIGYGRMLKESTLQVPKFGGINLHFSLLPKWRGAAPVQRTIEAGEKITGVTVFQMDAGMDTGPIWDQLEYQIPYGMSSPELFEVLAQIGATSMQKALHKIATGEKPAPQSGSPTIAAKVLKSECRIDWQRDADSIIRKIKAFSFNPGVYSFIRGEQLKILDARLGNNHLAPGELNADGEVGCLAGAIQLLTVTPAGRRAMPVSDWLNGFKPEPGERFE
ncbi:MAG: methionyl-tRNA formyltransferase [Candidatus Nanopelagicaceae bacterium]